MTLWLCGDDKNLAWDKANCGAYGGCPSTFGLTERETVIRLLLSTEPVDEPKQNPATISVLTEVAKREREYKNPSIFWDDVIENLAKQLCEAFHNKAKKETPTWVGPLAGRVNVKIDAEGILAKWGQ